MLQIFENGRSFLLIPVIAKTIGASGYGIWIQVKIGIAFLCPFILMGVGDGILRYLPGSSKDEVKDGVFSSMAVVLTTAMGAAILILSLESTLHKYIGSISASAFFVKGLALLCVSEPLSRLCTEYFISFKKMRILLAFSILDTILEISFVLYFAYNGFGIGVIIFAFACARSIMSVIKSLYMFLPIGLGVFKFEAVVKYIKFGFPLITAIFFFYVTNYIDRYLIGFYHSTREVGIYSLAYSIGYIVVLASAPWDRVLVPTITSHWNEGNKKEVDSYFNNSVHYVLITVIPIMVFLSVISKEVIKIISTPEFFMAVPVIPIMFATFLIFEIGIFYQRVVRLMYGSVIVMKSFASLAALNIILNFILIPRFSIVGAAIALFITYGTLFIIYYRLANKNGSILHFDRTLFLKCLFAAIPGAIFLYLSRNILLFGVIAAISLYFTILWYMGVIGKKEINFLKKLCYAHKK
jgi:O-antigen/teichoic acid export membrane protein